LIFFFEEKALAQNVKKTNPIGSGTKNLTVNVPTKIHTDLSALAKTSNMRLGEYCRFVLQDAIQAGTIFKKRPPEKHHSSPEQKPRAA